jgi:hypothetical protein
MIGIRFSARKSIGKFGLMLSQNRDAIPLGPTPKIKAQGGAGHAE